MPIVTFLPSGITVEVRAGTTVFQAAARAEVAIPSQCGGKCACALCRVKVVDGAELISPMRWEEEGHMGNAFFLTAERLSCQVQVFGDLTVQVPDAPTKEKERGRYIPYALVRKREKMEQEEEMRRVHGNAGRPRSKARPPRPGPAEAPRKAKGPPASAEPSRRAPEPGSAEPPPPQSEEPARRPVKAKPWRKPPPKSIHRRKRRNPGAPRPGDHRPPKGKSEG